MSRVFAFDVGASSYRVMEGTYVDGNIHIKERARFKHAPVCEEGHYYWDIHQMKEDMIGVLRGAALGGEPVLSIGFDTFGTDFALISGDGKMMKKPLAYRDNISDGMYEKYFTREEQMYEKIGGTYTLTSTAHLLAGIKESAFIDMNKAGRMLLMPDLLTWMFTGIAVNEFTVATTTRLLDIKKKKWDMELIKSIGIPKKIFHPLVEPGCLVGTLKKELASEISNLEHTVVVTTGCHDTASAAATIPEMEGCSFISSGSWSVKGILTCKPYTSKKAFSYKMVNEGMAYGKYRLLRNITGLWLLEECVREWKKEGREIGITELTKEAEETIDFPSMIYTDAELFKKPGNMIAKIGHYCRITGQKIPKEPVECMKTIINGLVCEYRKHNEELYEVTGQRINTLYIVGGGRHNQYLNQCAAEVTGCRVICGHPEATALGNILIQLKAHNLITSEQEFAQIASSDVPTLVYEPRKTKDWEETYKKYLKIRQST